MAQFPDNIYTPRETENLPGIVYDPTNKQNMYSEDFQNLGGEIEAIETYLDEKKPREVLQANRTYYVRTDGNDSNSGLVNNAGGAFLTIQKAIDTVASLDISIYNIIIQVADGTYTAGNILKSPLGSGKVTIRGNTTTPSNVLISTTNTTCFYGENLKVLYVIEGFKLVTSTAGNGIYGRYSPTTIQFQLIEFGYTYKSHVRAGNGASLVAIGNFSVSGGSAEACFQCVSGGKIAISQVTITLSNTPVFASFVWCDRNLNDIEAFTVIFSGTGAIGVRYNAMGNSAIFTNGGGETYFPGDTVGQLLSGAVYY